MKKILFISLLLTLVPTVTFGVCTRQQNIEQLRRAIFYEARDQSYKGKAAVAAVIFRRNKVRHFTTCETVLEDSQFSYNLLTNKELNRMRDEEWHTWKASYKMAEYFFAHRQHVKLASGLTTQDYFMTFQLWNSKKRPYYSYDACKIKRIGSMIFYNLCGRKHAGKR